MNPWRTEVVGQSPFFEISYRALSLMVYQVAVDGKQDVAESFANEPLSNKGSRFRGVWFLRGLYYGSRRSP